MIHIFHDLPRFNLCDSPIMLWKWSIFLPLPWYYHYLGNGPIYFRCHGSGMVLPADDLGWGNCFHGLYRWLRWLVLNHIEMRILVQHIRVKACTCGYVLELFSRWSLSKSLFKVLSLRSSIGMYKLQRKIDVL